MQRTTSVHKHKSACLVREDGGEEARRAHELRQASRVQRAHADACARGTESVKTNVKGVNAGELHAPAARARLPRGAEAQRRPEDWASHCGSWKFGAAVRAPQSAKPRRVHRGTRRASAGVTPAQAAHWQAGQALHEAQWVHEELAAECEAQRTWRESESAASKHRELQLAAEVAQRRECEQTAIEHRVQQASAEFYTEVDVTAEWHLRSWHETLTAECEVQRTERACAQAAAKRAEWQLAAEATRRRERDLREQQAAEELCTEINDTAEWHLRQWTQ